MSDISQSDIQNLLLRAMDPQAFELLRPTMESVELPLRFELVAPKAPTDSFYFLESGLGSVVASNLDDESVEVGHVGYEGMAGYHSLLKVAQTPNRTSCPAILAPGSMPKTTSRP